MVILRPQENNSQFKAEPSLSEPNKVSVVPAVSDDLKVSVHQLSQEGVLVTVNPPRCPPNDDLAHVPCDIVLVIDISWSMSVEAPVISIDNNNSVAKEHVGYSVLDISKHAALTVLETLDDRDRLGIVTFSTSAKVVQELEFMKADNKTKAAKRIRCLRWDNATNLWQGVLKAIELFDKSQNTGRVPAILVLTDGQPNLGEPVGGYVQAMKRLAPIPAAVHTFGFGNAIQSGLLKTIAEVGGGSYSFIPDSGMVGTVFVNAVAHLQSTFANRCTLQLKFFEKPVEYPEDSEYDMVDVPPDNPPDNFPADPQTPDVHPPVTLGNLQYGQSRDIFFTWKALKLSPQSSEKLNITAEIQFSRMGDTRYITTNQQDAREEIPLAYHQSRALICEYIKSLFPIGNEGEYSMPPANSRSAAQTAFGILVANIPAKDYSDLLNRSLMQDLEDSGQVDLAVSKDTYWGTWGCHYLLSLWDAHDKQVRNTFKDPGVQVYDMDSPFFLECQRKLTDAFNTAVTPPEPSLSAKADKKYSSGRVAVSMAAYNNRHYPCFSASTLVGLANGSKVAVSELRKGMAVRTLAGSRKVVCVLKTRVQKAILCRIRKLLVTPWHPIMKGESWTFPALAAKEAVKYSGAIYSILLQQDSDPRAHAIQVGGVWAVTLGHGVVSGDDARAHGFLGDYSKVSRALSLVGIGPDGVAVASGVRREGRSGSLSGFKRASRAIA